MVFLKHKLFFLTPAEHRAHVQSRARMEVNLMLLPLGAAGAHRKEQWVALLSHTALPAERGWGDSQCPSRMISAPVSDCLPTCVPHKQSFDRAGVQNEGHADG